MPAPAGVDVKVTRQPQLYAATIITYCLAVLALGLRLLSRRLLKSGYGLSDWFAVGASLTATGFLVSTIVWLHQGYGVHFELLEPEFVTEYFKNLFVGEIFSTLTLCLAKYSILAFYWRLFGHIASIRLPIHIIGSITTSWGIAVILVTIFQCTPVSGFWNRKEPAKCTVDDYSFFFGNAIPNILTDVALMALPLPYIWRLNRPTSQKFALAGVFAIGGFVIIISIVRIVALVYLDLHSPDLMWNIAPVGIWTETESNIAIVCACLPSCRPILSLILTGSPHPKKRSGYSSTKRSGFSLPIKASHPTSSGSNGGDVFISDNDDRHIYVRLNEDAENPLLKAQSFHTTVISPTVHEDTQEQPRSKSHPSGSWLCAKALRDRTGSVPPNDWKCKRRQLPGGVPLLSKAKWMYIGLPLSEDDVLLIYSTNVIASGYQWTDWMLQHRDAARSKMKRRGEIVTRCSDSLLLHVTSGVLPFSSLLSGSLLRTTYPAK